MSEQDGRIVSIVDDDASLRRSLRNLLMSAGFRVETFESAEVFLESGSQLRVRGSFRHFGQRLDQLVFGAVEIFEFVVKEVFEAFEFHTRVHRAE